MDASSSFAATETTTDGHVRFAFIPLYLFWSVLIITSMALREGSSRLPAKSLGDSPSRTSVDQERDRLEVMPLLQDITARHHDDAEWEY
jgi:hypothetical protein